MLTHVILGNGVTQIYDQAFLGTNLLSITIPYSVNCIGAEVFDTCKTLIFKSTTPCNISSISFRSDCTIYVTDDSYKSYCQATNWIIYASNIRPISLFTNHIRTVDMTGKVNSYIDTHLHPDYLDNTIVEVALGKYVDETFEMNPFEHCVNLRKLICSNLHSRINLSMIYNALDINGIQYTIDHWSEGASIDFSGETANYLKGEIVLNEYSCWEENTLVYCKGGGGYYYYPEGMYPYIKVWLSDGTVIEYDSQADIPLFATAFPNNPVVKVTLGKDVNWVDSWFENCSALTTVTISDDGPSLVLSHEAFATCKAIKQIIIPARVTDLLWHALYLDWTESVIIMKAVTPPYLYESALSVARIYVPDESLEAYRTATNWNQYVDKIFPIS